MSEIVTSEVVKEKDPLRESVNCGPLLGQQQWNSQESADKPLRKAGPTTEKILSRCD